MLDTCLSHRRDHHASSAGQAGEDGTCFVQRVVKCSPVSREPRFDIVAVGFADIANLKKAIDEQPEPRVGLEVARLTGMGRA